MDARGDQPIDEWRSFHTRLMYDWVKGEKCFSSDMFSECERRL